MLGLGLDDAKTESTAFVVLARSLVFHDALSTVMFASMGLHLVGGSEDKVTSCSDAVEVIGVFWKTCSLQICSACLVANEKKSVC